MTHDARRPGTTRRRWHTAWLLLALGLLVISFAVLLLTRRLLWRAGER
jgi:hypothetical protein